MAEIKLTRPDGYKTDRLRAYQIYIDGQRVEKVKPGETKIFTVPPGRHELRLKQDWAASEKQQVDLGNDDRAEFVCAPRVKENDVNLVSGLRTIYWSTLGCRSYIDLRQGNDISLDESKSWVQKFDGPKLFGIALVIGVALWALTGQSLVAIGAVVAAMAIVVFGLIAKGIGRVAVQATEEVQKRRDG
jgi:hypothetical protein